MTHTYKVTGMTCGNCEAKVKSSLLMLPGVTGVDVSKQNETATISMDKHIALPALQNGLDKKYTITALSHNEDREQAKNWFAVYKPVLLIFIYITTVTMAIGLKQNDLDWMHTMNIFMAGFFISFSFFKMLNLKGFAESYAMYDIVAKRIKAWGFIYAFIELALGIAYSINFYPLLTNIVTLVVMTVSIIGVLQSVLNKRKIQCACLGAVFNLPMSTVTIIEDVLMIVMSAGLIFVLS